MTEMEQRHDPDAPRHTSTEQMLANLRATLPNGSVNPKQLAGSASDAYVSPCNSDLGRELLFQHIRQMLPNYTLSVSSGLKHLSIPTLIAWGEETRVTPLARWRRSKPDIS